MGRLQAYDTYIRNTINEREDNQRTLVSSNELLECLSVYLISLIAMMSATTPISNSPENTNMLIPAASSQYFP